MSDLISRQRAIELIHNLYPSAPIMRRNREWWEKKYKPYIEAEKALKWLPSADPQKKKGKWIYLTGLDAFECSVCGEQMVRNIFDYCPWCGAEMRGEQDG